MLSYMPLTNNARIVCLINGETRGTALSKVHQVLFPSANGHGRELDIAHTSIASIDNCEQHREKSTEGEAGKMYTC